MAKVIQEVSFKGSDSSEYVGGSPLKSMVVAQPQQKCSYKEALGKRHLQEGCRDGESISSIAYFGQVTD